MLPLHYCVYIYFNDNHVLRLENAQEIKQFQGLKTYAQVKDVIFGEPFTMLEGSYAAFAIQRDQIHYFMIQYTR